MGASKPPAHDPFVAESTRRRSLGSDDGSPGEKRASPPVRIVDMLAIGGVNPKPL